LEERHRPRKVISPFSRTVTVEMRFRREEYPAFPGGRVKVRVSAFPSSDLRVGERIPYRGSWRWGA
jgi:hypothetical protein